MGTNLDAQSTVSIGLLAGIFGVLFWGAWSISQLHQDVESLKRIAVVTMGSRWRCAPQMKRWAEQLDKWNPELIVPPVDCEDDSDLFDWP